MFEAIARRTYLDAAYQLFGIDGKPIRGKEVRKIEELLKAIQAKTGLSHDRALGAVQAVIDYIKGKLPSSVAGQIDNVLQGTGGTRDMAKGLGGIFGKG